MNRKAVVEKVKISADKYGSSNTQQIEQVTSVLKQATDRELFFGLFSFFYDPELQENNYQRQKLAGLILFKISPKCPLELDGAIYAIPKHWDRSIEELPWYLCKAFGKAAVQKFLKELLPDVKEGEIKESFKTMLFLSNEYK